MAPFSGNVPPDKNQASDLKWSKSNLKDMSKNLLIKIDSLRNMFVYLNILRWMLKGDIALYQIYRNQNIQNF